MSLTVQIYKYFCVRYFSTINWGVVKTSSVAGWEHQCCKHTKLKTSIKGSGICKGYCAQCVRAMFSSTSHVSWEAASSLANGCPGSLEHWWVLWAQLLPDGVSVFPVPAIRLFHVALFIKTHCYIVIVQSSSLVSKRSPVKGYRRRLCRCQTIAHRLDVEGSPSGGLWDPPSHC